MRAHDLIAQRTQSGQNQKEHHGRGQSCAADAAESPYPEATSAVTSELPRRGRLGWRRRPNGLAAGSDLRLPVKRLQHLRTQRRRRTRIADTAAQYTAYFLQILQQFAALIAVLDVAFDLRG